MERNDLRWTEWTLESQEESISANFSFDLPLFRFLSGLLVKRKHSTNQQRHSSVGKYFLLQNICVTKTAKLRNSFSAPVDEIKAHHGGP